MNVVRYEAHRKSEWDSFVARSKNGVFLFMRDYMEYHRDRFSDHSLLFYEGSELIGLLPANQKDGTLESHGGLTFGGVVTDKAMTQPVMLDLFDVLVAYMQSHGIRSLLYKAIPRIYHTIPAEEDLYALFMQDAKLVRRDPSSAVDLGERLKYQRLRERRVRRARAEGLTVRESRDFRAMWSIVESNLSARYGVAPVHSAEEITALNQRFPDNIRLFCSYREDTLLAGAVIYGSRHVAHVQYGHASDAGKEIGALDIIYDHLINDTYRDKRYFDIGTSVTGQGRILNRGVMAQKEGFGGRTVVHDFYVLEPAHAHA